MSAAPRTTITGRLTADPQLRHTQAGAPIAHFSVASTPRTLRDGQWEDGEPLFLDCTAWRRLAEAACDTLRKGSFVVVTGTLGARSYDDRDGRRRTVIEMHAEEIGVHILDRSLRPTPAQPAADPWQTAAGPQPPF